MMRLFRPAPEVSDRHVWTQATVVALRLELIEAADALERAAYQLRDAAGLGMAAGDAMTASRRARDVADQR